MSLLCALEKGSERFSNLTKVMWVKRKLLGLFHPEIRPLHKQESRSALATSDYSPQPLILYTWQLRQPMFAGGGGVKRCWPSVQHHHWRKNGASTRLRQFFQASEFPSGFCPGTRSSTGWKADAGFCCCCCCLFVCLFFVLSLFLFSPALLNCRSGPATPSHSLALSFSQTREARLLIPIQPSRDPPSTLSRMEAP